MYIKNFVWFNYYKYRFLFWGNFLLFVKYGKEYFDIIFEMFRKYCGKFEIEI